MPSIFEKPSLLGFRQEGGDLNAKRLESSKRVFMEAAMAKAKELGVDITELLSNPRYADIISNELTKTATSPTPTLSADYGMAESDFSIPVFQQEGGRDVYWRDVASALASETPQALTRFNQPVQPTAPVAPAQQPASMFQDTDSAAFRTMFPNSVLGPYVSTAPEGTFDTAAPPAGSRAERVAAAMKSGDFETKRAQYNQEAMRLGQPTQMDAQGNIVGRELSQEEKMREAFNRTGGNTPFMQTTDPMQRALQNEMMKQARAQATVNTFGFTPEERLANLQAATDARKIPQPPLSSEVREVAPGVRAAFKDGQVVGVFAPGDGSPATMNDPLKKYITNPDGSVSLNPNPPQILMSDEMKDTLDRQKIEGKTGGSPMERRLIAAMAAEAKKATAAPPAPAAPTIAAQSEVPPEFRVRPNADADFDREVLAMQKRTAQSEVPPEFRVRPNADADFDREVLAMQKRTAQSEVPPEFRVRPNADADFDREVLAMGQRRAAALAAPALGKEMAKLMEQVNNDPEVKRSVDALARSRAQSAADAPQINALNAYRDEMNKSSGMLDSAIATNANPLVLGMFPPASTGQNQADSAGVASNLDAAQAAYDRAMGKPSDGKKQPRGPTYLEVPPNATNQRALELAKQLVAPTAQSGFSAFDSRSMPTSAFAPTDSVAPTEAAATTGAKDKRKPLSKDKSKKVVRGPTYLEVPPNATNQRARG